MVQQINRAVVTSKADIPRSIPLPSKFDLVAPPFPRNHARILYNNLLVTSSVSATGGSGATNTLKANTYERFTFGNISQITFTLPSNQNIDTIAIGAHNLSGTIVRVYYDINGSGLLRHLESKTAGTEPLMFHFDTEYSAKRVSIKIESESTNNYIGYISAGIALQLQRPFYSGHVPINDSDQSTIEFARTQSGQIIANSLMKRGYETSVDVKNIDDGWFRQYFIPFRDSAKTLPFFFAWNLLKYPNDVGLCRLSQDIQDSFSGVRDLRNISFNLLGA